MTAISRPAGSAPPGAAPSAITWLSGIGRVFEYRLLSYRRTFRASIFNSFVGPALFLAAMGVAGLIGLVVVPRVVRVFALGGQAAPEARRAAVGAGRRRIARYPRKPRYG